MTRVPDTNLIECDKCDLVLRVEGSGPDFEQALDTPTWCHLVSTKDIDQRRRSCKSRRNPRKQD